MRLYTFCNMYLSSIQQGIQTAHVLAEIYEKYRGSYAMTKTIVDWAVQHKTIIVCNGGYSSAIRDLAVLFDNKENNWPWATFSEGFDALDGALTIVGIVLPEYLYNEHNLVATVRGEVKYTGDHVVHLLDPMQDEDAVVTWCKDQDPSTAIELSSYEVDLIRNVKRYGLAR